MSMDDNTGAPGQPLQETDAERHALAELGIGFDGRQYCYGLYRYDRATDAVACARLERTRGVPLSIEPVEWAAPPTLSAADRECMAKHHIDFNGRSFTHDEYRYDRLADALNAALRKR